MGEHGYKNSEHTLWLSPQGGVPMASFDSKVDLTPGHMSNS